MISVKYCTIYGIKMISSTLKFQNQKETFEANCKSKTEKICKNIKSQICTRKNKQKKTYEGGLNIQCTKSLKDIYHMNKNVQTNKHPQ